MKREKEYYRIYQGMFKDNKYIVPTFPVTDESMLKMLSIGIAKALGTVKPTTSGLWGSGIYERDEEGNYTCISSDWDTSG